MRLGDNIIIGSDQPVLVIPEIGINHNGDLDVAREMVKSAYEAGARIIKHQTHVVEDEMSQVAKNIKPGNSEKSIYEVMSQAALSKSDEKALKDYAESFGLVFLSTPFSRAAADRLEELGVCAYKIGSGELNNYPLIRHIASFGKPMIVSTGMNDINAVRKAVSIMSNAGVEFALMHTTNLYPTLPNQVRLGALLQLMDAFPGVQIGLSDHTLNNNSCIAAMGLGATIVERHYTDKKNRVGPDIVCSMDKDELESLLQAADEIPQMRGGSKRAIDAEQVTIDFAFASVVSIRDIKVGDELTESNLWVKRPGVGEIRAEDYDIVLGKRAVRDIPADTLLEWGMIDA